MEEHLRSILTIALVAVIAPMVAELQPQIRLPMIVLEIGLGMIIGSHGFNLVQEGTLLNFLGALGLGFLFFMAGFEIDFARIRGLPIKLASWGWLISFGLAFSIAILLHLTGFIRSTPLVAVALCTTAIGSLMPMLKDGGELETRWGVFVLGAGIAGEFFPMLAISLVLSHGTQQMLKPLFLIAFMVLASGLFLIALNYRPSKILIVLRRTMESSAQLPVRMCILSLMVLIFLAHNLGADMILGAFVAGMLIALVCKGEQGQVLRQKLDGLSFGFFIPFFFISTGIKFDFQALTQSPNIWLRVPIFLVLFLLVRGLPVVLYRHQLERRDLVSLAFFSATALPLVVAIAEIGLSTGRMLPENATALVGAGMVSLLIFPLIGLALRPPPKQIPGPEGSAPEPE
jgi:Kef-type K+ transport system membrane component KefB